MILGLVGGGLFGDWRDRGNLLPVLTVAVLLVAFAFYSGQQRRTFGAAVHEIVSVGVAEVLPPVPVTDLVLLCLFWALFGSVMGLPWRLRTAPAEAVLTLTVLVASAVAFAALWTALSEAADLRERVLRGLGIVAVWLLAGLVLAIDRANSHSLGLGAALRGRRHGLRRAAGPASTRLGVDRARIRLRVRPPVLRPRRCGH